jgi:aminoglycoside phosphotransferase family enzyme
MHSVRKEPDLGAKIAFLRRPDSYPEPTVSVEVVESHRSFIFLTDHYAYKLKKPVRGEAFDFSTLDARRQNCHHEIRLNRRLAENVYLSVVAITIDGNARLSIEGDGEPVEWLVKMRKLNRDRMLDHCIVNATVTPQEVESVGHLLGVFYSQSAPSTWSGGHYCRYLADSISSARVALLKHSFGLPLAQIDKVAAELSQFIEVHRAELIQRVRDGRIIDAHGDLRPEHICLESPPVIIDCLEFNHELRIMDAASEMSFLTQECELLGAAEIGQQLWQAYAERTNDYATHELRRLYAGYHAFLRASLAIAHLLEQDIRQPEKWKPKAQRYLDIACMEVP